MLPGCDACNLDGSACLDCNVGYFLDQGGDEECHICAQELEGCGFCDNRTNCISCMGGYFLDNSTVNGECTACEVNLTGCLLCHSESACVTCKSGYYLDLLLGTCSFCDTIVVGC